MNALPERLPASRGRRLARVFERPELWRFLLAIAAAAALIHSVWFIRHVRAPEAWGDFWLWVDEYRDWVAGRFTFGELIEPLNEHRLATSRLVFLVDAAADRMNGMVPTLLTVICLALEGGVLFTLAGAGKHLREKSVLPLIFWIAWMGSTCQVENLQYPFNVHFAVLLALSTASICLLAGSAHATGYRAAIGAVAAGICFVLAAFTMAAGVLLVPILLMILVLRRARWQAVACVPLLILGPVVFFWGFFRTGPPPGLDRWDALPTRFVFICNFLGSALWAFPRFAPWLGGFGLVAFTSMAFGMLRRARHAALPAADTALLALAGFVVLSAATASFTGRIAFGASGALTTRYGSLSLVFLGCLASWSMRRFPSWFAASAGAITARVTACLALLLVNVPAYTDYAEGIGAGIRNNDDLLANNVGVEGPTYVFFGRKVPDLAPEISFLHAHRLNIFAPDAGPPPATLAALSKALSAPRCAGSLEHTDAVDDHAVLVDGWAAWSRTAPLAWIVARDGDAIIGSARPLVMRPEIGAALAAGVPPLGFTAGFRMHQSAQDGVARTIDLFGIQARNSARYCLLARNVGIPTVRTAPLSRLSDLTEFPAMHRDIAGSPQPVPGLLAWHPGLANALFWRVTTDQPARLAFRVDPAALPAGNDLIIPFSGWNITAGSHITFRMQDGATFSADLHWPWDKPEMLGAILPRFIITAHPGPLTVEVEVAPGQGAAVGAPLAGGAGADWSKLF